MRAFRKYGEENLLSFASPSAKLVFTGCMIAVIAFVLSLLKHLLKIACDYINLGDTPENIMTIIIAFLVATSIISVGVAIILFVTTPTHKRLQRLLEKRLYKVSSGNPMGLTKGTLLPEINVTADKNMPDRFVARIKTASCKPEVIEKISATISSAFTGRFKDYAVVQKHTELSYSSVNFYIEDVNRSRKIRARDISDILTGDVTKLIIQDNTVIDLTSSGSILICGKTRSGKTTAVESILMEVLSYGEDFHGSRVVIIDPKNAELSTLKGCISPVEGDAHNIMEALQDYEQLRIQRQKYLNDKGEEVGKPVHWWEANMKPCFLFIDEWVALRGFFPSKADKDDPDYNQKHFDELIRRIVTMGSSAGCFVIISVAEASVEGAGIPSMIRSAIQTKILMRPTRSEALFLWDSSQIDALPERLYKPGDAWFSSTDGINDNPMYVEFPELLFEEYAVLQGLISDYSMNS